MAGPTAIETWAASGGASLTGRADGPPLGPPEGFVEAVDAIGRDIVDRAGRFGAAVAVDPFAVLTERAAIAGSSRHGRTSCGGATKLLEVTDGWIAVSLPRPDDVELLPAWLGVDPVEGDPWTVVAGAVRARTADGVVGAGAELGLAVSRLDGTSHGDDGPGVRRIAGAAPATDLRDVVVVDLSALWAGPLCGAILADAGATVVKVESTGRPDGARRGPRAFFDVLNAGKRSVALDLTSPDGRRVLASLVEAADVVIEASRPRALAQLGVDAERLLAEHRPSVWVSITAHGRTGPGDDRIGFGDDAAVAGGLVAWEGDQPRFLADAVADPLTGLVAAATALDLLGRGGSWLADVAMAAVASRVAGPTLPLPDGVDVATPRVTRVRGTAVPMGADTEETLGRLLGGCP